jgi:hypothetical protein
MIVQYSSVTSVGPGDQGGSNSIRSPHFTEGHLHLHCDHLVSERVSWRSTSGFRGSVLSVAVIDGRGLPLLGRPINQPQTHRTLRRSLYLIWVSLYLDWLSGAKIPQRE